MIKEAYNNLKQYWRIYLLSIAVLLSMAVIFSPVIPGINFGATDTGEVDGDATFVEKYTGIQFSIELGGGTRIRAPLDGVTAENVNIGEQSPADLEESLAGEFNNTPVTDVSIREQSDGSATVEVTSGTVSKTHLENALDNRSITYDNARNGVTSQTRQQAVRVLQSRIDAAGLSGGSVREVQLQNGNNMILVEVPNLDRQETINLITRRGDVRIDIYSLNQSTGEYNTREAVLEQGDFRTIGTPRQGEGGQPPNVPVTIEDSSAEEFQENAVETGVARSGGSTCQYDRAPNETEPCLLTVVDGDVVYSAGMSPGLAQDMQSGDWSSDPQFILQAGTFDEAQDLSVNLQSGGLPAPMDIENGDVSFISPQQGEDFRLIALIVGIIATLAVAFTVSLRYGKIRIALPMIFTAFAEVIILIAIAVILRYPVDVAVIAGFVAVIGTGVDDLIIIADRIIGDDSPAQSLKLFDKRFRSAMWIILGAAGTTILALGPIAVLNLRALQGFAIFTIIGVIVGVLITRPAYGDILRIIYTKDH